MSESPTHYRKPGFFTTRVFNPIVAFLTRRGISIWGSRVLEVRGRTSGEPRRVPVNLLTLDDHRYLVAPRGEAQWVRNVRAAAGRLRPASAPAARVDRATELDGAAKIPVLRGLPEAVEGRGRRVLRRRLRRLDRRRAGRHRPPPPRLRGGVSEQGAVSERPCTAECRWSLRASKAR